jgi:hypothetical protein
LNAEAIRKAPLFEYLNDSLVIMAVTLLARQSWC